MGIYQLTEEFAGRRVVDYDPGEGITDPQGLAYRVWQAEDDEDLPDTVEILEAFLADPLAVEVAALVIGAWEWDMGDSSEVVTVLAEGAGRLPGLRALFLGDIPSQINEISWIRQSDVSRLFAAFPHLEELRVRGGTGLELTPVRHDNLRSLTFEAGGLPRQVVLSLWRSQLPALEKLVLWLGDHYYGGDATLEDLRPVLSGTLFPNLTYLGLCNCEFADELAEAVVNSPVVRQVEVLDLSLGNLGNAGARALLALPTDAKLRRLDIRHHYVAEEVARQLRQLPFEIDTSQRAESGRGDDPPSERYCAHSE